MRLFIACALVLVLLYPPVGCNTGVQSTAGGSGSDDQGDSEVTPGASLADIQAATWLVVATSEVSYSLGTAFAVGKRRLATNAHVVEGLKQVLREPNARVGAFQHETGAPLGILQSLGTS